MFANAAAAGLWTAIKKRLTSQIIAEEHGNAFRSKHMTEAEGASSRRRRRGGYKEIKGLQMDPRLLLTLLPEHIP